MRSFNRICLRAIVTLALSATCHAQGTRTGPGRQERPPKPVKQMAVIESVGVSAPETRKVGRATLTYHAGQDATSVSVTLPGAYRQGKMSADVEFTAGFKGREFAKQGELDGEVHWTFVSEWDIFGDSTPLTVTADGEQYSFEVRRDLSIPGWHAGTMDFASFIRIANSERARLSVGRVNFYLTEDQRETMRDLLKVFGSPAKQ